MAGVGRGARAERRQRLDPLKALRRITDHLLDHLAEIEATLAGQPTVPDSWLGRTVTLESDWARFTEADLNEASNRLLRYAELYRVRLGGLSAAELDLPRPSAWTVRQIAHHVAGVTYYAHRVGDLTVRKPDRGAGPAGPARRHSVLLSPGARSGGPETRRPASVRDERPSFLSNGPLFHRPDLGLGAPR